MSEHREGEGALGGGGDHGDRRAYRQPTCFSCHEVGHYANQCPNQERRQQYLSRPSTSSDSRRSRSPRGYERRCRYSPPGDSGVHSKIAKLSKNIASMKEQHDVEARRKEGRARRKWEKAEAARLEAEEKEQRETWEAEETENRAKSFEEEREATDGSGTKSGDAEGFGNPNEDGDPGDTSRDAT
ncbi:hypothetical protein CBR_g8332 [Chara braunii]|uniref:CCHC-type domain-containing protein n=1 Tax=Chara braunii TaxID=69332 RepID=A0A388KM61_CHABU|nr:hypothetical protein CBR_g8332 [Chara braunii]|eukprot:GBG71033.1 hypothetical protein CBR_g8332 [Chara braunii]